MTHKLIQFSSRLLVPITALVFALSLAVANVHATDAVIDPNLDLEKAREKSGFTDTNLYSTIGGFISIVLGILGVVALVIFVAGGFIWMTSGGSEDKIGTAKKLMSAGIIGIVIVLLAYGISKFVIDQLLKQSGAINVTP